MRPKSTSRDLPPRMLRRKKTLVSGREWIGYYYNGRDAEGRRIEEPLGTDLNEAKRRWAELECKPAQRETGLMSFIFDRYEREIVPLRAPATQRDYTANLRQLSKVFGTAPIDAITPQHVAQYRDKRGAKVRANRELALLSHVFNLAREWGYTAKDNPVRGVRKNRETPRDFYVDEQVWSAVYACAPVELQDAMDLNYLTGQRPADVLKMTVKDIKEGALEVRQGKTNKRLRILLDLPDGSRNELGLLLDRIRARSRKVSSLFLVSTPAGVPLNRWTLRVRFDAARKAAVEAAEKDGGPDAVALAERVRKFQFRDIRPRAASDIGDLASASKLLGHTEQQITRKVYRRVGETVKPTK